MAVEHLIDVMRVGFKASISQALKSPLNIWLFASINASYYLAQGVFWWAVIGASKTLFEPGYLLGFLATVMCVDNVYLLLLGKGSVVLADRIRRRKLDAQLVLPVNLIVLHISAHLALEHAPLALVSVCLLGWTHVHLGSSPSTVLIHVGLILSGMLVLGGISFLFRLSAFWTLAIVNVRNSNPSFKVMVKPFESFSGVVRYVFIFLVPCLLITGVPAAVTFGSLSPYWSIWQVSAALLLWVLVFQVGRLGIRQYARQAGH